jgi:hypothetical protein
MKVKSISPVTPDAYAGSPKFTVNVLDGSDIRNVQRIDGFPLSSIPFVESTTAFGMSSLSISIPYYHSTWSYHS